ncbi:BQ5605_C008g05370 [Microbotryum silenes-dioicae]|uniref:BQ5605_C008g05370 protein n=1 Tax=Microbotryum silenes-dioicae TaxID=796604 RepID=A0A2X0MH17_9BASI|nr:BQ5605_C008g05370 [Microbotryum silenes-dioicae]
MLSNKETPPRENSTWTCLTCGTTYDRATKASSSSSSSSSSSLQNRTTVLPHPQCHVHELAQPQPQRSLLPTPIQTQTQTQLLHSLKDLIESYQALNSSTVTELRSFPDALEFCRDFVGVNRPLVIRSFKGMGRRGKGDSLEGIELEREGEGVVSRALRKWDRDYLVRKMGERKVLVAVSPDGKADSIVRDPKNGKQYFVEPASVQMNLSTLFQHLNTPTNPDCPKPVYYLQSQNGNLQPNQDLEVLLEDVGEKGPEWARQSFGTDPDAVNVWIGDERSETSLHKDPYENIYLVIRGTKTFTLYPPTEFACLREKTYPHARWVLDEQKQEFGIVSTEGVEIPWLDGGKVKVKEVKRGSMKGTESIGIVEELFHSESDSEFLEVSHLDERPLSEMDDLARPLTVVLNEGDYLYLPSLWFHAVRQEGVKRDDLVHRKDGEDRAVIAVNWWYDMKMHGDGWSMNEFLRAVSRFAVADHEREEEPLS